MVSKAGVSEDSHIPSLMTEPGGLLMSNWRSSRCVITRRNPQSAYHIRGTKGIDIRGTKGIDIRGTKEIDIRGTKGDDIRGRRVMISGVRGY